MRHARLPTMFLLAITLACATSSPRKGDENESRFGDLVINSDQIDAQHAPNAWELLRQLVPRYTYVEDRSGRAVSIHGHRGRSSIALAGSEAPLVIVDGARLSSVDVLQQMATDAIDRIELRGGSRGTSVEGTGASAGVIYIHTRSGS
ncbi:MAG TPA: TonB-dependent receptor plug domain-containing protein [Gemmatimonadaceae bacterium]